MTDPYRPVDDDASALCARLLAQATHAALAVVSAETETPSISRIALARAPDGAPLSLVSTLAPHTGALARSPACALLIGEPGDKGDPLTHPRLTLHCTARLIARDGTEHDTLRAAYLAQRPKAALYADFADFHFLHFAMQDGLLNAGFGKACKFTGAELLDAVRSAP